MIVDISLDNPGFSDRLLVLRDLVIAQIDRLYLTRSGDCADRQIALDMIAVKVCDAPKLSSSSSASSGHPQRSCSRCPGRMSSFD